MFSELLDMNRSLVIVLVCLLVMSIALYLGTRRKQWNSRRIANAAMCIAIAYVLSCIKLYRAPQGGAVTPASTLPLIAFAVACGPLQGAVAGCAYGLLGLLQDPVLIHPIQILVDYPLASGALALGGLVNVLPIRKELKLPVAVLLGNLGRYAMNVLSGTIFFASSAPVGQSALIYSLIYNISYIGLDVLLCTLIAAAPGMHRLATIIRGNTGNTR